MMKKIDGISHKILVCALSGLVVISSPALAWAQAAQPQQAATAPERNETHLQWPRTFMEGNLDYTVYQPQVDSWDGSKLEVRAAVAVQAVGAAEPKYGVAWMTAKTAIDRQSDMVTLENIEVAKVSFPSDEANSDAYLQAFRKNIGITAQQISLSSLQAGLSVAEAEKGARTVEIRNDPPRIIFSAKAAVLERIDGKPVLRSVPGSNLLRVINTTAPLFFDEKGGTYYLRAFKRWYATRALETDSGPGKWERVARPPSALDGALKSLGAAAAAADTPPVDIADAVNAGSDPDIYVSFTPAELIQTSGDPDLVPIPDTKLLHVKNTSSHILVDETDQSYYVLISGRWFKSNSLTGGAWSFVPSNALPADFARIPENNPAGVVLASVSGTPQAKEALIDNAIPQMARVARSKARLKVTFDGDPQLRPIEGTKLQYVINASLPVILATDGRYYAVENGVWFTASAPKGPWAVAAEIPAEIYGIPASSPLHYVTYVRVYGSSEKEVYVGYTPGYFGTVAAPGGVIVYGTGYAYDPWISDYWYPAPATYGFGAGFAWGAVTGFVFGAVASNAWYGGPWGWGWGWHGWGWGGGNVVINNFNQFNFNNANIYNRWRDNAVHSDFRNQLSRRINAGAGRFTPQQRAQLRNNAGNLAQRQNAVRNFAQQHPRASNNLFAGKDGHVYRRGPGGWQRHDGRSWGQAGHQDIGARLNADQMARFRGNTMGGLRGNFGGGFHGGGFRGGGFRGGGGFHGFRR